MTNPQAAELNEIIRQTNPYVYGMLSEKGRNIFFPTKGILAQTAEARGKGINATIGTALEDTGIPMVLTSVDKHMSVGNKEVFSYAPSFGKPEIRMIWKNMLLRKNPSLTKATFSTPVVTNALTHGLSMTGYVFIEQGDEIITPDLFWENYELVFNYAYGSKFSTFPTFNSQNGFNIEGLRNRLNEGTTGKKIVILNFPNNPTGYTISLEEAQRIKEVLVESAQAGNSVLVFIDDAYFGLVFEEGIYKESMFSLLANAHERILAIKLDGPTKEDYVWGFRVGFVTFGTALNTPAFYSALESKLGGAIRGNISSSSNLGQSLLLSAYHTNSYEQEKQEKLSILQRRYIKIKEIFNSHLEYSEFFQPLPFNSGYFMCVEIKSGEANKVRQILLEKYNTGVIAQGKLLRIAFSSTPYELLEMLFDNVYHAAKEV